MSLKIQAEREPAGKASLRELHDRELEQEVAAITEKYRSVKHEEQQRQEEGQEAEKKEAFLTGGGQKKEKKETGQGENADSGTKKPASSREWYSSARRSDNPDVVYGRDFEGEPAWIEQITGEIGEVILRGQILELEARELRNEKTILIFSITDFTDTIGVKLFLKNEQAQEVLGQIKKGGFYKLRGVTTIDRFDSQLTIGNVFGIKKIPDFREKRMDTSPEKRVELHCHTKMSDMDGVSDVKDIIERAMSWGALCHSHYGPWSRTGFSGCQSCCAEGQQL